MLGRDELDIVKRNARLVVQSQLTGLAHKAVTHLDHDNPYLRASHAPMLVAHAAEYGSMFARGRLAHAFESISLRSHWATAGLISVGFMSAPYKGLHDLASRIIHQSPFAPPKLKDVPHYDFWKAKTAVQDALRLSHGTFYDAYTRACRQLGYPSNFSYSAFRDVVKSTGLVRSYNNINPSDKIPSKSGHRGEIGGVATDVGMINGLKNGVDHVLFDEAIICMPTVDGKKPFSDLELKQIMRELANGIYIHNTFPFFSLHFNDDGVLYPVIHPAYQNTLVGKVIGLLDYYMKCFLNGGYFDEDFIASWHETQNKDREYLKKHRKDLKVYCREHKLTEYISLREQMCQLDLEETPGSKSSETKECDSVKQNKFRTSFRIIAGQKEIQKHNNIFIINPDFRVEYTIDLMPDYKERLEKYYHEHGSYPEDYLKLQAVYRRFAIEIKEIMPKIPFCRDYFQMLGVISFLCYYFATLKEMGKTPVLPESDKVHDYHFPKALPPIPVRHYQRQTMKITAKDIFNKLVLRDDVVLNQWLLSAVENPDLALTETLQNAIKIALKEVITAQLPDKALKETDNFIEAHEKRLKSGWIKYIKEEVADTKTQYEKQLTQLVGVVRKEFNYEVKINSHDKLVDKIQSAKRAMESMIHVKKQENEIESISVVEKIIKDEEAEIKEALSQLFSKLITDEEKTINEVLKKLEGNRQSELAKVHAHLRAQAAVVNFNKLIDTKKQEATTEIKKHFSERKEKITADIQEKFELRKVEIKSNVESQKRDLIRNLDTVKEKFFSALNQMSDDLVRMAQSIFLHPGNSASITANFPYSVLEITDSKEVGENVKIVGGCAIALPNITPQPIKKTTEFVTALWPITDRQAAESYSIFDYEGKQYSVFRLPTKDKPAYGKLDHIDLIASLKKESKAAEMSETETKVLSDFLSDTIDQQLPETKTIAKKMVSSFDPIAKDSSGQTLTHYVASLSNASVGNRTLLTKVSKGDSRIFTMRDNHGYCPIHIAAKHGNLDAIAYFVESAPGCLNIQSQDGLTPLMLAAQHGRDDAVDLLLKLRANVNLRLPNGLFALYIAIQNNHVVTAMRLINRDNVNFVLDSGSSVLHLAIEMKLTELTLALLKAGASPTLKRKTDGYTPFHIASELGLIDVYRGMLPAVDINLALESGKTSLHLAAANGHFEIIELLVESKPAANLNIKGWDGETALMVALRHGHTDVAVYLAKKAEINSVNRHRQTASLLAAQYAQFEVADILIARGENPLLADDQGHHYIYHLVRAGEWRRYKTLVEKKKEIRDLTYNGLTNIEFVACCGHYAFFEYLYQSQWKDVDGRRKPIFNLYYEAIKSDNVCILHDSSYFSDLRLAKDSDKTGQFIAAESGSEKFLRYLMREDKSEPVLSDGRHVLYAAIMSGKEKIILTALEFFSDINIPLDKFKNTAAHIAVKNGFIHLIDFIHSHGGSLVKRNQDGLTSLHVAIEIEDEEMLRKLYKVTPKEEWPTDIFEYASRLKRTQYVKIIRELNPEQAEEVKSEPIEYIDVTDTPLHKAIREEEFELAEKLIKEGSDVNAQNRKLITPLMLAVIKENIKLVQFLLTRHANPNLLNIYQSSALHLALQKENTELALQLIAIMKDKNQKNRHGNTPLMLAANLGLLPIVKVLSKYVTDLTLTNKQGFTVLHCAAETGHADVIQFLVEQGAEVDAIMQPSDPEEARRSPQFTALHIAAQHGQSQAFFQLINLGADPGKEDRRGSSVVEYAIMSNKPEMLRAIQELSITHQPDYETRLFLAAASANNIDALTQMLLAGFNINAQGKDGRTALHHASINDANKAMALLIEQGIVLDTVSSNGNTALHDAAFNGAIGAMRQLCDAKIDVNVINADGMTPLHLACEAKQYPAVLQLLKVKANINLADKKGLLPYHHSQLKEDWLAAEVLITCGSSSTRSLKINSMPLHMRGGDIHYRAAFKEVSKHSSLELIKIILLYRPDFLVFHCQIEKSIAEGYKMLTIALKGGKIEFATYLKRAGAKTDNTQFYIAMRERKDTKTILNLIEFGETGYYLPAKSDRDIAVKLAEDFSKNNPELKKLLSIPHLSSVDMKKYSIAIKQLYKLIERSSFKTKDYVLKEAKTYVEYSINLIRNQPHRIFCSRPRKQWLEQTRISFQDIQDFFESSHDTRTLTEINSVLCQSIRLTCETDMYAIFSLIGEWKDGISSPERHHLRLSFFNNFATPSSASAIDELKREVKVKK